MLSVHTEYLWRARGVREWSKMEAMITISLVTTKSSFVFVFVHAIAHPRRNNTLLLQSYQRAHPQENWCHQKLDSFPSRAPSVRSGSSRSQVPLLTTGSTSSSVTSTLTDAVLISIDHKPARDPTPDDNDRVGGLVDEDETRGKERDAATSSPVKGKMRVTSSVSGYHALYQ
jgi:hypothetical protein